MNRKLLFFLMLMPMLAFSACGEHTYTLKSGWNLISTPYLRFQITQNDCGVQNLWTYANAAYSKVPYSINSDMGANFGGIFVYARKDCSLVAQFPSAADCISLSRASMGQIWDMGGGSLNLKKGWNLVAGFSDSPSPADVAGDCKIISGPYYFDTLGNQWVKAATMAPYKGYAVKVDQDCKFGYFMEPALPALPN